MKRLACSLAVAFLAACAPPTTATAPNASANASPGTSQAWADRSSPRRRFVAIDLPGADAFEDFPVLVVLDPKHFDYGTSERGADLRFVDATGTTLAHEIDTWDARGTSAVWVRMAKVDPKRAGFWMYYGSKT